jgi:hypothetical protein
MPDNPKRIEICPEMGFFKSGVNMAEKSSLWLFEKFLLKHELEKYHFTTGENYCSCLVRFVAKFGVSEYKQYSGLVFFLY